jgi:hypothetical protein
MFTSNTLVREINQGKVRQIIGVAEHFLKSQITLFLSHDPFSLGNTLIILEIQQQQDTYCLVHV